VFKTIASWGAEGIKPVDLKITYLGLERETVATESQDYQNQSLELKKETPWD
jgi:hypothetical protein